MSLGCKVPVVGVSVQPPGLTLFTPEINGLTVRINGVATPGYGGATITRIFWSWSDGYSGNAWFPASHTYRSGATYSVTVSCYQSDGLSTTKSVIVRLYITPSGQPPSLTLFSPEISRLSVRINGVATPGTSGATITRIFWDWGDGYSGNAWFPASHTYGQGGVFTVTVTAYQSDGLSTTRSITFEAATTSVSERLRISDVKYPASIEVESTFVLDVVVEYMLQTPDYVTIDIYENAGSKLGSRSYFLAGSGSQTFSVSVTAPSSARDSWNLNIHLQGDNKKSIDIKVEARTPSGGDLTVPVPRTQGYQTAAWGGSQSVNAHIESGEVVFARTTGGFKIHVHVDFEGTFWGDAAWTAYACFYEVEIYKKGWLWDQNVFTKRIDVKPIATRLYLNGADLIFPELNEDLSYLIAENGDYYVRIRAVCGYSLLPLGGLIFWTDWARHQYVQIRLE